MKKELGIAASLMSLCFAPALAEEEKRDLGAHEHGHSALNLAIEGDQLDMELIAPGADIVGFEYEAESAEDKAAVERAKTTLGEPLALFGLSDAAGCAVKTAAVEIEGEEHHEEGEHAEAEHDDHEEHGDEASHNEFHAAYTLTCSSPDALDRIDFAAFFETFAGAEEVEVTVVGDRGQASYEVERDEPVVELK